MPPRTLADGRYELLEPLGEGGMAAVYRAIDHRLDVHRAIKLLSPKYVKSRNLKQRFYREAKLMARLEHPAIVGVHDVGEVDGSVFIVMSLHPHGSVHDHLKRFGPMPAAQAVEVIRAVLRALVAAHRIGVVHRDIKPHNVLIDEHGNARLADFGIAHSSTDHTLTRTGALMGTWAYMAPEQRHSAKATDARSDLYAVGAMLLALLKDTEPHDLHNAESHAEQLEGIEPGLAAFIQTCTRYRPEERYDNASAALEALDALDIEPAPRGTPPLGSAHMPAEPLPDSTIGETNETLLAFLTDDAGSRPRTEPTMTLEETAPTAVPAAPSELLGRPDVDPNAPTALGSPTEILEDEGAATVLRDATPQQATLVDERSAPPVAGRSIAPVVIGGIAVLALFGAVGAGLFVLGPGSTDDSTPTPQLAPVNVASTPDPTPTAPTQDLEAEPAAPPQPPVEPIDASDPKPPTPPAAAPVKPPEAPVPTPPPAPSTPPSPDPEPAPTERPEPTPATPGPTGRLTAFSLPASEVFVDGTSQGNGRVRVDLPPGWHTLRFVPPSGEPIERRIEITPDRPTSFCWNFNEGAVCSRR